MRLFLLPISTKRSLIFCQREKLHPSKKLTLLDKLTTGASAKWLAWEKSDKGWMKKITVFGNKLFQRISYEEWGLKSIPPLNASRKAKELERRGTVQVDYPSSVLSPSTVHITLRAYGAKSRQLYHTKWLWASIIGMPLSTPAALVPMWESFRFAVQVFHHGYNLNLTHQQNT